MTLVQDAEFMIQTSPQPYEWVTYTPYRGIPRQIKALVTRMQLQRTERNQEQILTKRPIEIFVSKDPVKGVNAPTIGKDIMEFLEHLHDSDTKEFSVAVILSEDPGAYRFGVAK